jgi:hypothetical protein
VSRSVVILVRVKDGDIVDFGTGFIIFANRHMILICVDRSLIKDDESILVRFHDNSLQTASVFVENSVSRHAVLEVGSVARLHVRPVSFSESVTRQDIFTAAAVHLEGRLGMMTGSIGCVHYISNF